MVGANRESTRNDLDLLVQVAESYYLENKNQAQIAAEFGLSTATISRLLSRAREEGIVRINIVRPQARHGSLEAGLRQKYGLAEAIVAGMPAGITDDEAARRILGLVAAPYIDALIRPGTVVGIGRGRTLAALAEGLQSLATPRQITVVQILGEYGVQNSPMRTSEITRLMAESYSGNSYYLNVPAQVEDRTIAEALRRAPGISDVIAVFDRLDMALVGVGPLRGSPLEASQLLSAQHLANLEAAGAVGEICGHYFDSAGRSVDAAYSGCAMGISWNQLQHCPRVVAVAAGNAKIEPLRALAAARLIHVLATDELTARQILELP